MFSVASYCYYFDSARGIAEPWMRKTGKTPAPGRRVQGSRTGRPIMALIDLLGRRWAMRVIWELRDARLTFRALQEACDAVSPSVLNERLRELRESRLVDLVDSEGYGLTPLGRELLAVFLPLVEWSKRWARTLPATPARAGPAPASSPSSSSRSPAIPLRYRNSSSTMLLKT